MAIAIMQMNEHEAPYSASIACNSLLGKRYGFEQEVLTKKIIDAIHNKNILLVAKKDETIVGFAWVDPKGCFSSAPYLRLIAVDEHCRGHKIGSLLLEAFERQTQYVGRDFILLVSDFNEQAIHFYEKNGYKKRGELSDFVIQGVNEIMMVKKRIEDVI
jgi:ribosomal protein S18 acetylase RimI-like enzyme